MLERPIVIVIIIVENDFGLTLPPVGIVNNPDDEAAGGQITIDFLGAPITARSIMIPLLYSAIIPQIK